jgi:hypothetical protein
LHHAYRLARVNAGAPGVDEVTFAQIEERGLEAWLAGLREELVSKTYRPDPVRRVMIPKPNGEGERALGIPTIRDRVIVGRLLAIGQAIAQLWNEPSAAQSLRGSNEVSSPLIVIFACFFIIKKTSIYMQFEDMDRWWAGGFMPAARLVDFAKRIRPVAEVFEAAICVGPPRGLAPQS